MPKPHAVSHHVSGSGICVATVTTIVNPIQQPPLAATLLEPALFNVDPLDFTEGLGDDGIDEDVSREYHIARVSDFYLQLVSMDSFQHQDNPLLLWTLTECNLYLNRVIQLKGQGVFTDGQCKLCHQDGIYHCIDCIAVNFLCEDCIKEVHHFSFFHEIKVSLSVLYERFCAALTCQQT